MERIHGGDVYSDANAGAVDFSANINPLGLPSSVKQALVTAAENCGHYPDPLCRGLRAAIGKYEGFPAERIFCAAGAAEILYRIAWAFRPRRALVMAPTFSEYRLAVESVGGEVCACPLCEETGFAVGDGFIRRIDGSVDLVFFCNPNNPTGAVAGRGFVEKAARRCAQTGALLAVDECFMDFVPDGEESCSAKPLLKNYGNILVLKAFTKIFAMPGVRLGYCLAGDRRAVAKLARSGPPWSVSVFAQAAGVAAAEQTRFVAETQRAVTAERRFLKSELSRMGLKVYDAKANFLLFRARGIFDLQQRLLRKGFIIRHCADFESLDGSFYRIAVRTPAENRALVRALEASL